MVDKRRISPDKVERALAENPEIKAVLLTSPTYDGVVSDIEKIAEIVHRYEIPLIVDEAHGAHFHFSNYFPTSAAELGADLVIQSFHKTLPSMTQTAVLHNCSDRVDSRLIRRFMGIYQSSSPSYILMASMDACMEKCPPTVMRCSVNLQRSSKRRDAGFQNASISAWFHRRSERPEFLIMIVPNYFFYTLCVNDGK